MNKAIITVVGQDTVGIIARVCTYLSDHKVNVLDISQTIIDGFFNMMMIVDYSAADESFGAMAVELESLGEEIGVPSVRKSSPPCIESKLATAFVGKKAGTLAKGACAFRAPASRGFAEVRAFSMRRSRLSPPQIHHFGDVYL